VDGPSVVSVVGGTSPFSPYTALISAFTGPQDEDQASVERAAKIQDFLAECMKGRGFDYTPAEPVPLEEDPRLFAEGDVLWLPQLPASRAEAAVRGYGVMAAPPLASERVSVGELANRDYRDSLGAAAQAAYDQAFTGTSDPYAEPDPDAPTGCTALAFAQYPEEAAATPSPEALFWDLHGELAEAMDSLVSQGVGLDPRTQDLNAEWNACMTDRAYDLTSGNLYSLEDVSPWAAWTLALRTMADGRVGDAWYNYDYEEVTPVEQRSLAGTPAEVAIALDDYDCRAQVDYERRYRAIQLKLEQAFVERHRPELDSLLAFADTRDAA
jgi:hypothetical protein